MEVYIEQYTLSEKPITIKMSFKEAANILHIIQYYLPVDGHFPTLRELEGKLAVITNDPHFD